MASDDKKNKTNPVQKNEVPPKKKDEVATKNKSTSSADLSKTEGGGKAADAPSGYSRGEGQKPVSKAYKENWDAIYAKKKSDNWTNGADIAVVSCSLRKFSEEFRPITSGRTEEVSRKLKMPLTPNASRREDQGIES